MASPQSSSLIEEYSHTFTKLQTGKRELIQWGADAVVLNRYIVDAAGSTSECDPQAVLQPIDLNKVTQGDTELDCINHCKLALKKLIALQEEVTVLQKSARESGISAGLLTIIGQAASQSPGDNGASVLKQLSELLQDSDSTAELVATGARSEATPENTTVESAESQPKEIAFNEVAANDVDRLDFERLTGLQKLAATVREQWQPLLIDASASMVAVCIAISLIN